MQTKYLRMKRTLAAAWLTIGAVFGAGAAPAAYAIDHLEPPSWWVGMRDKSLQLMLHGPRIAELTPRLEYPGVRITGTQRGSNPNYLFVNLAIAPQAKPGSLPLRLLRGGTVVLTRDYPLHARAPGSAERAGFGPADAIYQVVPDRFASGTSSDDTLPELLEGVDRAAPGGRHGGDLAGLRQHLDYIAAMGFTQIWPTPLTENNSTQFSYHGYASTDFYSIDARFGSNAGYRQLVAEARSRGIGVIQDIVLNHIGLNHWWMRDLPSPDWVHQWPSFTQTQHARVAVQDPHAAASDRREFTDGWFSRGMPDLNQRQPQLATYLTQMSIWWVEYAGLSGLRIDTYSYSDKAFLAAWSARLMQEYPRLNMVGEEWSPHPAIVAYWQRGKRNHDGYVSAMPSMMDFPLHGALLAALGEADSHDSGLTRLYEGLAHDFVYPDAGQLVLFVGNHDTPRIYSLLQQDLALTKMALAFIATANRIPQFFYGDEILLQSPRERDDGAVRADMPGGWAGDAVNAFSGAGLSPAQREMQDHLRRLLNWRKTASAVHRGKLTHYAPKDGAYVFFRHDGRQKLMVVLNKNGAPLDLATRRFGEMLGPRASGRDVLNGTRHELAETLRVPARTALILEISD